MAVTSHPPHRPVLAGTTAYGSYLGSTRCVVTSGDMERRLRTPHCPWGTLISLICVRHVLSIMMFSLVTGLPSTTSAAGISTDLVRWLRWYYADVRLLAGVHARVTLLAFRADPVAGCPGCRRGLSVLARAVSRRAYGSWTTLGLPRTRDIVRCNVAFPLGAHSLRHRLRFSKLDSSPVDASVYTSPGTSRHPAQDSRSRWFATPFLWGSFIPDYTPVYPDACAPSPSRLCNAGPCVFCRDLRRFPGLIKNPADHPYPNILASASAP